MIRKIKLYFSKYFSTSFGLAFILALPLFYFIFEDYSLYELKVLDKGFYANNRSNYWIDFNSDGVTEYLSLYEWNKDFYSLPINNVNGTIINQFNIQGNLGRNKFGCIAFGDYDNNSFKEFYLVTNVKDSIFLNVIEPLGKGQIIGNQFLDITNDGKAGYDYEVNDPQLYDVDNDGNKEFVVSISGGFNLTPRRIYIYDILKKRLTKSDQLGSKNFELRITDINNDNNPEFLISNFASGNMRLPLPKTNDHNAYVTILDRDLNPLIPRDIFEGETQHLKIFPLYTKGVKYWCLFNKYYKKLEETGYVFYLLDYSGNIIKTKVYDFKGIDNYLSVFPLEGDRQGEVLVVRGLGEICSLGANLELNTITNFEEKFASPMYSKDLDGDKKDEFIFLSKTGTNLYVFRDNFKNYEKIEIGAVPNNFNVANVNGKYINESLYIQIGNQWFDLSYLKKTYYYPKLFVLLLTVYFSVLLLVIFIQKMTAGRDRRRKKMAELQLTSWKNQLDPHFTFNTLNSVGAVILSEERYKAYDFFARFSKLMRYALEASSKISVRLEEEIRFIDLYLQLEQFRFKNHFTYQIDIDSQINKRMQVPKMLLQTYVENAVRHGLLDRQDGGELRVKVYKADKNIVFQIEDNGIGRKNSSKKENLGSGVGMKVMRDYFNLLNSVNNKPIRIKVLDQNESDSVYPGTIVYIVLPVGFSYEL